MDRALFRMRLKASRGSEQYHVMNCSMANFRRAVNRVR